MNLYNPNSPNLGTIHGKMLRINPDGSIPGDNPFVGVPGAEPAIWAYGLRNPFRFDVIPSGPHAGKPIVGDVGGSTFEEINIVDRGANYGWPASEGFCTGCGTAQPIFAYPHTAPPASAGSVTALAVYTGHTFPHRFHNAVFYGDYTLGFVRYLVMDQNFTSVISDNVFDGDAGTPVQLSVGPDGNLYQLNIFPGALYRIAPSGGNRAPSVAVSADKTDGLVPLTVAFSSAGTIDLDGDPLTFAWDFRDGSPISAAPNPTHQFTANGVYNVTLTVSDGAKSGTATIAISVGNLRPTATITAPAAESRYNAGDRINYAATATDPEDGSLPSSAFSWSVVFHHADHIHPFLGPFSGPTGSFVVPRNADNLSTTWYELVLTVTDSRGLTRTRSVHIRPNLVNLTFKADPAGVQYLVDGIPFAGTHTEVGVVGVERVLSAVSPQFAGGQQYQHASWSDGGALTHTIRTPATDATYQANFTLVGQPPSPWTSEDIGAFTIAGSSRYQGGTFTIAGGGTDIWSRSDEFRYVYQPLVGDGEIVARVASQTATNSWSKSGVMIKESATAGAKYAAIAVTPANGLHFQYNFNGDAGAHPYSFPNGWMKLVRTGDLFSAYRSGDGVTWTPAGSTTLPMAQQVTIGLFVTSHAESQLCTSTFDHVSVTSANPPPSALPAPWQRVDVGGATPAGTATHGSATFSVDGGGTDIWGDTDESSYVWQPLTGDGTITARVASQEATADWAKAGVMVKASTAAGSPYAAMLVTPDHGLVLQANFTTSVNGGSYTLPNAWVRLVRTGGTVTAYRSANGSDWTKVGEVSVALPQTATIGLVVSAHADGTALSSATFDNVSVTSVPSVPDDPGGGLPAGWSSTDMGAPDHADPRLSLRAPSPSTVADPTSGPPRTSSTSSIARSPGTPRSSPG